VSRKIAFRETQKTGLPEFDTSAGLIWSIDDKPATMRVRCWRGFCTQMVL